MWPHLMNKPIFSLPESKACEVSLKNRLSPLSVFVHTLKQEYLLRLLSQSETSFLADLNYDNFKINQETIDEDHGPVTACPFMYF